MANLILKGNTSGQVTIQAPDEAGTTTLTLPTTNSTLATQNALGVRNLIINGDMRIAQRGTSATGITSSGYRTVDRFNITMSSGAMGTWTITQDTDTPSGQGFSSSLKLDCTTAQASPAAGSQMYVLQYMEAQNLQHLNYGSSSAQSLTLSFWVKSNKTGTTNVWMYQEDSGRGFSQSYTIDTADTWEKKTITIAGDTSGQIDNNNGAGMRVAFYLGSGTDFTSGSNQTWATDVTANRNAGATINLADSTSNYINITGVQLEVGDTATPFEHRPYDMELARCQRYYEIGFGRWRGYDNGFTFVGTNTFQVTKRATPTVVAGGGGAGDITVTKYSSFGSGGNFDTGGFQFQAEAEL